MTSPTSAAPTWAPKVPGHAFCFATTASVRLNMPWEPSPSVQEMAAAGFGQDVIDHYLNGIPTL